jgi:predicted anti-sigma-YlaC factor YlaD
LAKGCTAWAVEASCVVVALAFVPTVFSEFARPVLAVVNAFVGAIAELELDATFPCEVARLLLALDRPVTGAVAPPAALPY